MDNSVEVAEILRNIRTQNAIHFLNAIECYKI